MDNITATLNPTGAVNATVVTPAPAQIVFTAGQGLAGPQGDKGDKGERGDVATRYEHEQTVASDQWVVNHNLGYKPAITVVSVGGLLMLAEVLHMSLNQARVYFDSPVTGTAICS